MNWDYTILHLINRGWTHPLLDWLMPAASAVYAWTPVFVIAILTLLWRERWRGAWVLFGVVLAVLVSDGLVAHPLKKFFHRVRPAGVTRAVMVRDLGVAEPPFMRLFVPVRERRGNPKAKHNLHHSFPSSHCMNVFAVATVVAGYHRRWGLLLYGIATLVAYSRVYCGAHWPSDVVPSSAMGVLIGWAVLAFQQWALPIIVRRRKAYLERG